MSHPRNIIKATGFAVFILTLMVVVSLARASEYQIIVDEHDRPLPIPTIGWYYNCTGGDRGLLNDGPTSYSWDGDSTYRATVVYNPGSWTWGGMWYSLIRIDNDNLTLDFKAIFGPYVKSEYQGEITEVALVVSNVNSPLNNTSLELRLELKNETGVLVGSQSWTDLLSESYPTTFTWSLSESEKQEVETVSWVMDYAQVGDSISVDAVRLKASVPDVPTEEQAFLWTYSWLMTNYDPITGMVQDRSNYGADDYENVTATAKTAKIVYYAYKKGYTDHNNAVAVITKIADTRINVVPRGPTGVNTLWPHFTVNGGTQIKPGTEWASGDTAFAALDIITALQMIGDPQNQISDLINFLETIDWSALLINGGISHGYSDTGSLLTSFWKGFGMETLGVNWAYASATGEVAEMDPPPSDNGSGFIDNACYPMVFSGVDRWGNDWDAYRTNMADTQIGWFCTLPHYNVYLCNAGLFGLSAAENPEGDSYIPYGVGGRYAGTEDGNSEVVVLHYCGMIADIRPTEAIHVWETLRDRNPDFLQEEVVISPLNNMESMRVNKNTGECTINHLKGSWNLALQAEGWALIDPDIKNDLMAAIHNNSFLCRGYTLLKRIVFNFLPDREEWTTGSAAVAYSVPDFSWEPGYLKIVSTTNTNCFGYWQSLQNAIPANPDYLYRARFNISTDITDQAIVPQLRIRANSLNLQQYDVLSIESAGDGGASPNPSGRDYDLYFVPPANDTAAMLAFDLLNFDPLDAAAAELSLDAVAVDRYALDSLSLPTVAQDYTFELSTDGWTTGGAPIAFRPPQYIYSAGALELRATTNTNTFGYWVNDPADITIEADRLYRGTFELRTDVTNAALVPEMRLRLNAGNFQASHSFGIASAGDGANSPGITNKTYDRLYFLPPENCVGQGLIVSFDILNFNPSDAATASLILDRAIIETLLPPALP